MQAKDVVSSDPEIVSGAVVFAGTRVPADVMFRYLAGGASMEEFLEDFPTVERSQAEALLRLASEHLEREYQNQAA